MDTYDVDGNHLAVEVDLQSTKSKTDTKTLSLSTESILTKGGGDSVGDQDSTSRVELRGDVICEHLLDQLLRRLLPVVRELLESLVGWCEDGEVGGRSIQDVNQIGILVDELGQFGGILGAGD